VRKKAEEAVSMRLSRTSMDANNFKYHNLRALYY
jgi:hypothetical protein